MFGIPNSEPAGNGEFLGRIQFDARVGFWTTVKRVQSSDGAYGDEKSEPLRSVSLMVDFATLEVGYIKLSSPPSFLVVPYGKPIPPQPEEMALDAQGKSKRAFSPGFRVKVCSGKTFGDGDAYYFSNSSKTVMGPMDELHQRFMASPEAAQGKAPIVSISKYSPVTIKTPKGSNTFHAPVFEIVGWADRPACLGEPTVPAPVARAASAAPVAAAPVQQAPAAPAPVAPAGMPDFGAAPKSRVLDDAIPF